MSWILILLACWLAYRFVQGGRRFLSSFNTEVMAGPMTWTYVLGEWRELWVEIAGHDWKAAREELSDVALCGQLALFHMLGGRVSWPIVFGRMAANKFDKRLVVWRGIFSRNGLRFENKYLIGGGNYLRPEKVEAALAMARAEQEPHA